MTFQPFNSFCTNIKRQKNKATTVWFVPDWWQEVEDGMVAVIDVIHGEKSCECFTLADVVEKGVSMSHGALCKQHWRIKFMSICTKIYQN